ncbi:MAG: helix-turn-helix domain-containing protein [Rothia sp. (in: high G+C Gram-positive bacteria)]|nr:helix-turn-helix domain-containing protein [Rothia sp. (in: high G+C Gram-positive bacteria)]
MTVVSRPEKILVSDQVSQSARDLLRILQADGGHLLVESHNGEQRLLSQELESFLHRILHEVIAERQVSLTPARAEMTSNEAAQFVGISRPTLMKLTQKGEILSHRVGSHTRFLKVDLENYKREKAQRKQDTFKQLREFDLEHADLNLE